MRAHTTISKPVKSACLLPLMECGKETLCSHGTISSTLHQVKFNCFHFLESLGLSPAGGGAKRTRWKVCLGLVHFTLEFYPPSLSYWLHSKFQPGKPLQKSLRRWETIKAQKQQVSHWDEHPSPWHSKQLLVMPQSLLSVQRLEFLILSSSFLVWFFLHTQK